MFDSREFLVAPQNPLGRIFPFLDFWVIHTFSKMLTTTDVLRVSDKYLTLIYVFSFELQTDKTNDLLDIAI